MTEPTRFHPWEESFDDMLERKNRDIGKLREALIFYRDQLGQLSKLPPGMPPLDKATLILVMLADLLIDAGKRAQEALGDD